MKLLAKNAEERYHTASGLEDDLRRCLAQWQLHDRIDAFPLGADEASDCLVIPEKLYAFQTLIRQTLVKSEAELQRLARRFAGGGGSERPAYRQRLTPTTS